jgi:hypothetical protein
METIHFSQYFISLVGLHYFYYILFIFHKQLGDERTKYIREEIVLNAVPLATSYLPFAVVISLVFSLKVHSACSSFVQ